VARGQGARGQRGNWLIPACNENNFLYEYFQTSALIFIKLIIWVGVLLDSWGRGCGKSRCNPLYICCFFWLFSWVFKPAAAATMIKGQPQQVECHISDKGSAGKTALHPARPHTMPPFPTPRLPHRVAALATSATQREIPHIFNKFSVAFVAQQCEG